MERFLLAARGTNKNQTAFKYDHGSGDDTGSVAAGKNPVLNGTMIENGIRIVT
jgi:hypothetical protein